MSAVKTTRVVKLVGGPLDGVVYRVDGQRTEIQVPVMGGDDSVYVRPDSPRLYVGVTDGDVTEPAEVWEVRP